MFNIVLIILFSISGWLTSSNFNSVVASKDSEIIVVEFWAAWNSQNEYLWITDIPNVKHYRVDIENNIELMNKYSIKAIPTILIFNRGKLITQYSSDFKFRQPIFRDELIRILSGM
jgi:thioredoxin-like negative regulator of GroEL